MPKARSGLQPALGLRLRELLVLTAEACWPCLPFRKVDGILPDLADFARLSELGRCGQIT